MNLRKDHYRWTRSGPPRAERTDAPLKKINGHRERPDGWGYAAAAAGRGETSRFRALLTSRALPAPRHRRLAPRWFFFFFSPSLFRRSRASRPAGGPPTPSGGPGARKSRNNTARKPENRSRLPPEDDRAGCPHTRASPAGRRRGAQCLLPGGAPGPFSFLIFSPVFEFQKKQTRTNKKARQLLAVDHSARASMKNAASCEN